MLKKMQLFIIRTIFRILFGIFYKVRVEGVENVPLSGRAILVSNHESFLDPMVLYHFIPRRTHAVAGKWLFKIWWAAWIFKSTECIPTNGSLDKTVDVLMEDKMILIFPEGICRRVKDGGLVKPHKGVALLALSTGAPVIPVAISGTFEAWPQTSFLPRFFKKITVRIGRRLVFERRDNKDIPSPLMQETLDKIMSAIEALTT